MLSGSGRAGDFAGDPLVWVASYLLSWANAAQTRMRVQWTADASLPAGSTWILCVDGVAVSHTAALSLEFDVTVPGAIPDIALVAVPEGVDADELYDPLGGDALANVTVLSSLHSHRLRGLFRLEDTELERYELFRGVDADPDLSSAPWQTFATLPYATPALDVSHTYKFVLRKRNKFNLSSYNIAAWIVIVAADGSQVAPPSSPTGITAVPTAGGVIAVSALYAYLPDAESIRADTWAIWLTTDGSEPDPSGEPTAEIAMSQTTGLAVLDYQTDPVAHGTTVKVLVRAMRSADDGASANTDSVAAVGDAQGPSAPAGGFFFGHVARQG